MLLGVPVSPSPQDDAGPQHPTSSPSFPTVDEAAEGLDSASAGILRHSRLLPLGSLSGDARSRAVALVQQLRQKQLDTPHRLAQLRHILDVLEAMQQSSEHNSQETRLCGNQAQANPCPTPASPGTQARPAEGCGTPATLPGQALAVGRMLAQELRDALVQLRAQVGQLPALLQQAAWRARRGVAELRGTFSRAESLWELLGTVVARGRDVVAQAWEALAVPWLEDVAEAAGIAVPRTAPPHPQT
ncbi:perilipin-3-like [Morphnus guianensis]